MAAVVVRQIDQEPTHTAVAHFGEGDFCGRSGAEMAENVGGFNCALSKKNRSFASAYEAHGRRLF
jgi:hypothetical protein